MNGDEGTSTKGCVDVFTAHAQKFFFKLLLANKDC